MRDKTRIGTQPVDVGDLRSLLIYSVRYAMGRQTYAPDQVQTIARAHRSVLTTDDLRQFARDIRSPGAHLGDPRIDAPGWLRFADWCVAEADREER